LGEKAPCGNFLYGFLFDQRKLTFKDLTLNTDHSLMGDLVLNLNKTHFADFTNKVF
jgi:hypothetical protein